MKDKVVTIELNLDIQLELVTPFSVDSKEYAAFIPKQDIYIFGVKDTADGKGMEFFSIEDENEFNAAQEKFTAMMTED